MRLPIAILLLTALVLAVPPLAGAAAVNPEEETAAYEAWLNCFVEANTDYAEWCGDPPIPEP